MKFHKQQFKGVWLIEAEPITDNRGTFRRHFCQKEFQEIGLEIKSAKLLFSWNHDKYNSILHFFLVPLTVEFEKLCLNEGQGMDLFSIEQIKKLPITPSLEKNIHKIKQNFLLINEG